MFSSPYTTTPFHKFLFEKTGPSIRAAEINDRLIKLTPDGAVVAVPPGVEAFAAFDLPLTKDQIPTLEADVVIDGRRLLTADGKPIKHDTLQFYVNMGRLTAQWMNGKQADLFDLGTFATKIYGTWIRNALTPPRLGFDFAQVSLIMEAAMVFFYQLHLPLDTNSNGVAMDRIYNKVARALPGSDDPYALAQRLGDIPPLNNLADFIDWLKVLLQTPKAAALTPSLLITAVGYSWGGPYRALSNAALEYPPIFLAMLSHSIASRAYSKTTLGELIKRHAKKGEDLQFLQSLNRLMTSQ